MLVVVCHPDFQRPDEGQASGPLLPPEVCFCERPPDSLGIRIPCRMVIAGEGWLNPPGAAGLHDGQRGWLAAWSRIQDMPWARAPVGNWRLTAMSRAASPCLAVQGTPASYPTIFFVYPSNTSTTYTYPKPSTMTLVISRPHHS